MIDSMTSSMISSTTDEIIGGIVLAAGQSRRFKGDKRVSTLQNGNRLLTQTISQIHRSVDDVIVVLRADDAVMEETLQAAFPKIRLHRAADALLGMGHSLAAGIKQIESWHAAIIFLGDMPYIKPETINTLIQAYKNNALEQKILIPTLNQIPGHPVVFPRRFYPELLQLKGDQGAKSVIKSNASLTEFIEMNDSGIHFDIDTLSDIQRAQD